MVFFVRIILYIRTTSKNKVMKKKITLSSTNTNVTFAKKYAKEKNSSVSELFNHYLETLKHIDDANKKNKKKDPLIEKFAGIFDTGSKDIIKDVFEK